MDSGFGSRPGIFWWTAASAALMVVGGFGPWATALGVSVSGTNGDGWFLIAGGVLAGALLMLQVARPRSRWPMIVAALLAALGALVAFVDLSDISSLSNDALLGDVVDPAWGLYVSTFSSLSLLLAAIVTLIRRPYATATAAAVPAEEQPAAYV